MKVAWSVLLLAGVSLAQRSPCTGTVTAADGRPLAGAEVTCVWAPLMVGLAVPDRVTATSDATGRFEVALVEGRPYAIWAIGPRDANGRRAMAPPQLRAAAGRDLTLSTGAPEAPLKLRVANTAAWLPEGPLRLRVLVCEAAALCEDQVIPGDGEIPLPPCPTNAVTAVLFDARGGAIHWQALDLTAAEALRAPPVRVVPVVATDQASWPFAGARVIQRAVDIDIRHTWIGYRVIRLPARLAATTGKDGRATARLVLHGGQSAGMLDCVLPGFAGRSGWLDGRRIIDGHPSDDDDAPLSFVLRENAPAKLTVLGQDELGPVAVGFHQLNTARGGLRRVYFSARSVVASRGRDGAFVAPSLGSGNVSAWVSLLGSAAAVVQYPEKGATEFDLRALPQTHVLVIDAAGKPRVGADLALGRIVNFAAVGLSPSRRIVKASWGEHLVTDRKGNVTLLGQSKSTMVVYAQTAGQHGLAVIEPSAAGDDVEIQLAAMPVVTLRIVDPEGKPVAGARIDALSGVATIDEPGAKPGARSFFLRREHGNRFRHLRSTRDGVLRLPLAWSDSGGFRVTVRSNERASAETRIARPGEAQTIEIR